MADASQAAVSAALDRMWTQFLPHTRDRVAVLESAAAAFTSGPLTVTHYEEAQSAAHKLAGALGMFGLTRGTVLARELELIYSRQSPKPPPRSAPS
jgi:HPt (histidine-containing phosphotransfer) domain-containing protein